MSTKICTSIEQSKKLLSLGLDPNTADMFYNLGESQIPNVIYGCHEDFKCYLLAWSLTALLELMPNGYSLGNRASKYYVCFTHIKQENITEYTESVDAAFEAVCWLIKQGHIKVNK